MSGRENGPDEQLTAVSAELQGTPDLTLADPVTTALSRSVGDAVHDYLRRVPAVAGVPGVDLLTALAFAQVPGLPVSLWRVAVHTLTGASLTDQQLQRFAVSSAANAVVRDVEGAYRLPHQAVKDALLAIRAKRSPYSNDQRDLADAFQAYGGTLGWDNAPEYLIRSLAAHAAAGDVLDKLLGDVSYLLHADLSRLLAVGEKARARRDRIRLLRLNPRAVNGDPAERLALLALTECLERNFGQDFQVMSQAWPVPYRPVWAACRPRAEIATFTRHKDPVEAVCALRGPGDRTLVASASEELTVAQASVWIWDPDTAETFHWIILGERIRALCELPRSDGHSLLFIVSAADHAAEAGTVRIWDPETKKIIHTIPVAEAIDKACPVPGPGRISALATITRGNVRIWDPETNRITRTLDHSHYANALCSWTQPDGRTLLATAEHPGLSISNSTVRIWDPDTGTVIRTLEDPGGVGRMCAWTLPDGPTFLATANSGDEVKIWDVDAAATVHTLAVPSWPLAVSTLPGAADTTLLVTGCNDRTARIWDLGTVSHLDAGPGRVAALCPVVLPDGGTLLATATHYGEVRTWDLGTGSAVRALTGPGEWAGWVSLCALPQPGAGTLLVTANHGDRTATIWDPDAGAAVRVLSHPAGIRHAWPVRRPDGCTVVVTDGDDRTVRIWDPDSGEVLHALTDDQDYAFALCSVPIADRLLLAISYTDGSVRFWDPEGNISGHAFTDPGFAFHMCTVVTSDGHVMLATTGNDHMVRVRTLGRSEPLVSLPHTGLLDAMCVMRGRDGHSLLAVGGKDNSVRIWQLSGQMCELINVPMYSEILALAVVPTGLAVGTSRGVVVIELLL